MSQWHQFGASNLERTCLWCGRKLRRYRWRDTPGRDSKRQWGDYGDNMFCGQSCGYCFAIDAARNGYRFKPIEKPANKRPVNNDGP